MDKAEEKDNINKCQIVPFLKHNLSWTLLGHLFFNGTVKQSIFGLLIPNLM